MLSAAVPPHSVWPTQAQQQQRAAARSGSRSSLVTGLRMLGRSRLFVKLTVCVMTSGTHSGARKTPPATWLQALPSPTLCVVLSAPPAC